MKANFISRLAVERGALLRAVVRRFTRSKAPRAAALAILLSTFCLLPSAFAAPLAGTYSVGPTGNYLSLTAAIADAQAQAFAGPVILELQAAYVSGAETFPMVFTNLATTAANTLTIRPETGATALAISSADTTAASVDLNGAQFVTFDGRPGGVGTAKQLTIANTSTSGVAVRFINEASGDALRFLTLRGVNTSASSGTVVFSTTTGANGNDNNTIDTCDIRDGASTPANAIYSSGSTGTTAQNNSGNTVANCNLFNFYSTADSAGVRLDAGNTDWIISGDSFYQTVGQPYLGNVINARPIYINNSSGNNFIITSNFIGGTASNANGAAWSAAGFPSYRFVGIHLKAGTATPSSIQGNIIKNIAWTTSSTTNVLPGVWSGIYVEAGSANIGTVTGNTIGSSTGVDSITVAYGGTSTFTVTTYGIGSSSGGTVNIANNNIGSITVNGSSTSVSASLTGIQVTAGVNTISNNIVGSATTANSLNAATSSTSATGQRVTGILSSSGISASITGNTVASLNNNYIGTASAGQIQGIVASAGLNTIAGNTVRNLSATSQSPGQNNLTSVLGIIETSTTVGQTVSQNIVHSLANLSVFGGVRVVGIYYSGNLTNGPNIIARNLVHSLAITSTNISTFLTGIQFNGGAFITVQNNMVRVGLDSLGTNTAGAALITGINDGSLQAGHNFYHNSVYVGGTETFQTVDTYAFQTSGVTNSRDFRNNIFVNTRTNSPGSPIRQHYAVSFGGGAPTNRLVVNNNLYFVSGPGGVLGIFGSIRTNLTDLQAATGQDASSTVADPLFINPTGNATAVDLHIQTASPASNAGVFIATVTNDFDGDLRSDVTPDIGADEIGVPNHRPVAGSPFTLGVKLGVPTTVKIIGGKHPPTDVDGDALTLTSVTGAANGLTSTDGTNATYTANSGSTDNFTCAISDGHGGTANQTVNVTITSSGGSAGYNQLAPQSLGGGTNVLTFLGTPNFNYALELSTNLVAPIDWQPQLTNPAVANGWLIFTNVTQLSPVFYRTRYVP